jgi:hypothetical protein
MMQIKANDYGAYMLADHSPDEIVSLKKLRDRAELLRGKVRDLRSEMESFTTDARAAGTPFGFEYIIHQLAQIEALAFGQLLKDMGQVIGSDGSSGDANTSYPMASGSGLPEKTLKPVIVELPTPKPCDQSEPLILEQIARTPAGERVQVLDEIARARNFRLIDQMWFFDDEMEMAILESLLYDEGQQPSEIELLTGRSKDSGIVVFKSEGRFFLTSFSIPDYGEEDAPVFVSLDQLREATATDVLREIDRFKEMSNLTDIRKKLGL